MSGHTPGPWKWTADEFPIDVATYEAPGFYDNPELFGGDTGVIVCGEYDVLSGRTREERIANARLIAAAPDLLAALEALAEELECTTSCEEGEKADCHHCALLDQANAAIEKAKGTP